MSKCFLFFHDWTKWKYIGKWKKKGTGSIFAKQYERECQVCGKVQQETVWL